MAGAISGALHGMESIPPEWAAGVAEGSRLDLQAGGRTMAAVTREVFARDQERFAARTAAFTALTAPQRRDKRWISSCSSSWP
jgi:hypothetical protein